VEIRFEWKQSHQYHYSGICRSISVTSDDGYETARLPRAIHGLGNQIISSWPSRSPQFLAEHRMIVNSQILSSVCRFHQRLPPRTAPVTRSKPTASGGPVSLRSGHESSTSVPLRAGSRSASDTDFRGSFAHSGHSPVVRFRRFKDLRSMPRPLSRTRMRIYSDHSNFLPESASPSQIMYREIHPPTSRSPLPKTHFVHSEQHRPCNDPQLSAKRSRRDLL